MATLECKKMWFVLLLLTFFDIYIYFFLCDGQWWVFRVIYRPVGPHVYVVWAEIPCWLFLTVASAAIMVVDCFSCHML